METDSLWSSLAFAFLEKITIASTEYLVFTYYFLAQDGNITRYVSTYLIPGTVVTVATQDTTARTYVTYVRFHRFNYYYCHSFIQIQILKSR